MGNHRFKLSDMMPNAWFYKLKDISTKPPPNSNLIPNIKTHHQSPAATSSLLPRKSYHFPRDLSPRVQLPLDPPRRSSKHARPQRNKPKPNPKTTATSPDPLKPAVVSSSPACAFSCRVSTDSVWTTRTEEDAACSPDSIFDSSSSPEFRLDRVLTPESLNSSAGSRTTADHPDIVIHVDENSFSRKPKMTAVARSLNFSPAAPSLELPRIITKPKPDVDRKEPGRKSTKKLPRDNGPGRKSQTSSRPARCHVSSSPRLRLKIRSPRLAAASAGRPSRPAQRGNVGSGPKLTGSLAVVKSSIDPKRDFRESMVEMIVEHNIKASKDLEELLACYLSLNSDEYHGLIIDVFKQIWFDLTDNVDDNNNNNINNGRVELLGLAN